MATDARLSVGLASHPKTKKLIRRLGTDGAWRLVCLFLWCASDRSDGNLTGMSDEDIELAADWNGEEGAFVRVLCDVGFIDGEEHCRTIHDWREHNPWAADSEARSEKARWAALCKRYGKNEAAKRMPDYAHGTEIAKGKDAPGKEGALPNSATSMQDALPESATSMPLAESSDAPSPSPSPSPSPIPKEKTSCAILPDSTPAKTPSGEEPSPEFMEAWQAYPSREGGNPRKTAWKAWKARIREGVAAQALTDAVIRYAAHCRAKGNVGTEHVMMGSTFFGPNERWKERYEISPAAGDDGSDDAGDWWLAGGFASRWEAENEGCSEGKAWMFEGGKQVRQPQDWQAYKAGRPEEMQR